MYNEGIGGTHSGVLRLLQREDSMDFKYILRRRGSKPPADTSVASLAVAARTRRFHRTIPGYAPTPLVALPELARELGLDAEIIKVTDYAEISAYGILRTPGLVVDEKVVSYGRVLNPAEVKALLQK